MVELLINTGWGHATTVAFPIPCLERRYNKKIAMNFLQEYDRNCFNSVQGYRQMTGSLTSLQLDQYRERGFIKPIRVFSVKRAHDICLEIERLERRSRTGTHPADIQQYFRVNGQVVIKLLADLGHEPAILDAVESIIGRTSCYGHASSSSRSRDQGPS